MFLKATANSLLASVLMLGLLVSCKQQVEEKKVEETTQYNTTKMIQNEKVLRHVVIFKFNDDSSEEDVHKLNMAFNDLPNKIPVIKDFEWGLNDSPEDFHQGFTHCYLLTFESEKDRDSVYTPHPAHKAFVESLQPHVEKVFVVDYWTNP